MVLPTIIAGIKRHNILLLFHLPIRATYVTRIEEVVRSYLLEHENISPLLGNERGPSIPPKEKKNLPLRVEPKIHH